MNRSHEGSLAPLWQELTRRYGASDAPVRYITLTGLDESSRSGIADLLGSDRLPPSTCRIAVARIAAALATDDLRAYVEALNNAPLPNRAAERQAIALQREQLWEWLTIATEGLDQWIMRLRSAGIPSGDVDAYRARLKNVLGVLNLLPASGVALPAFATDTLGDPHALDYGTWEGRVVVEALAIRNGRPPPRTAEDTRREWHEAGVAADMLSPTVLTLGLRPHGDSPLALTLRAHADAMEPAAVTLSQLRRWPLSVPMGVVHVFENPSILAEAARISASDNPIICANGWPNVAVITLLRQAANAACELRAHADFDPAGLGIVRLLMESVGATPWEMTAVNYEGRAAEAAVAIDAPIPETPWDPSLAPAMRRCGVAVYEEDLREDLLSALGNGRLHSGEAGQLGMPSP